MLEHPSPRIPLKGSMDPMALQSPVSVHSSLCNHPHLCLCFRADKSLLSCSLLNSLALLPPSALPFQSGLSSSQSTSWEQSLKRKRPIHADQVMGHSYKALPAEQSIFGACQVASKDAKTTSCAIPSLNRGNPNLPTWCL